MTADGKGGDERADIEKVELSIVVEVGLEFDEGADVEEVEGRVVVEVRGAWVGCGRKAEGDFA